MAPTTKDQMELMSYFKEHVAPVVEDITMAALFDSQSTANPDMDPVPSMLRWLRDILNRKGVPIPKVDPPEIALLKLEMAQLREENAVLRVELGLPPEEEDEVEEQEPEVETKEPEEIPLHDETALEAEALPEKEGSAEEFEEDEDDEISPLERFNATASVAEDLKKQTSGEDDSEMSDHSFADLSTTGNLTITVSPVAALSNEPGRAAGKASGKSKSRSKYKSKSKSKSKASANPQSPTAARERHVWDRLGESDDEDHADEGEEYEEEFEEDFDDDWEDEEQEENDEDKTEEPPLVRSVGSPNVGGKAAADEAKEVAQPVEEEKIVRRRVSPQEEEQLARAAEEGDRQRAAFALRGRRGAQKFRTISNPDPAEEPQQGSSLPGPKHQPFPKPGQKVSGQPQMQPSQAEQDPWPSTGQAKVKAKGGRRWNLGA